MRNPEDRHDPDPSNFKGFGKTSKTIWKIFFKLDVKMKVCGLPINLRATVVEGLSHHFTRMPCNSGNTAADTNSDVVE